MATKQYAGPTHYEHKLAKVMERFGVADGAYNWDCNRYGGWVEFHYKGQSYRFEHTVDNAKKHGSNLVYGSDAFAQIVLALEDLARIVERGIYDLQNWISGMRALPESASLPGFCILLGLDHLPESEDEVKKKYREMAHIYHPDLGGSEEDCKKLNEANEQALKYLEQVGKL